VPAFLPPGYRRGLGDETASIAFSHCIRGLASMTNMAAADDWRRVARHEMAFLFPATVVRHRRAQAAVPYSNRYGKPGTTTASGVPDAPVG
jgi:hypothetical protein